MKKRMLFAGFIVVALAATTSIWAAVKPAVKPAVAGQVDAKTAFEQLKKLAGNWNGRGDTGLETTVNYRLGVNGNVVIETQCEGTEREMMTMYFMAGNELMATHYCPLGNQPRFKLDRKRSTPDELIFAFDGGTSFDPAKDGHVHSGRINFAKDGNVEATWEFFEGGRKKNSTRFQLNRAAAK